MLNQCPFVTPSSSIGQTKRVHELPNPVRRLYLVCSGCRGRETVGEADALAMQSNARAYPSHLCSGTCLLTTTCTAQSVLRQPLRSRRTQLIGALESLGRSAVASAWPPRRKVWPGGRGVRACFVCEAPLAVLCPQLPHRPGRDDPSATS